VLTAGTRVGPYQALSLIGTGGMGEVYRARDTRLGRDVAIKVLPAEFASDPDRLRRFEQEARAVAALSNPHILALFDVGTHEGSPYLVTELLEGESLRERLQAGPLTPRKAIEVGAEIAQGLAAAHEKGIVHRDLKPANVFVTGDGHVKILDFGIAKLVAPRSLAEPSQATTVVEATEAGTRLGTVGYMSPEQVRGQSVDHRADIFSFGCVLYEMLSARSPFRMETAADTASAILHEEPPGACGHCQEHPSRARGDRHPVPGEAPGGSLPVCSRPGPRPERDHAGHGPSEASLSRGVHAAATCRPGARGRRGTGGGGRGHPQAQTCRSERPSG